MPVESMPAGGEAGVLIFALGSLRLAIPLQQAREVIRAVAVTPLPGAPAVIAGVINVRGQSVPVFDVRWRFAVARKEIEPQDHFILAWTGHRLAALHVDRAQDLATVTAEQWDDSSEILDHATPIRGVARLPDGLVYVHDLADFLSDSESAALSAALAQLE
jgi:purine-binding chemotaxis protein CheW